MLVCMVFLVKYDVNLRVFGGFSNHRYRNSTSKEHFVDDKEDTGCSLLLLTVKANIDCVTDNSSSPMCG